jgi:hypothetical protein
VVAADDEADFAQSRDIRERQLRVAGGHQDQRHATRPGAAKRQDFAMQSTFRRILAEGGIAGVESDIASVAEIFALQGDGHMRELEKAYLR